MQTFELRRALLLLSVAFLGTASSSLAGELFAADWVQFRGPNASGVAAETNPLPTEFSQTDKMKWSAKLGDGIA
jgi:hypothetical protein